MFGDLSLDVFQEDALLMNSAVVLPLVAQYGTINPLIDGPEEGNCNYGSFGMDMSGLDQTARRSYCGRTSVARTLMVCLPCLIRTCSWVSMIPYMILLWSNFCIYVFMLLFSFSTF